MTAKVLVVDDSALMRKAMKSILTASGQFDVHLARNGVDALEQLDVVQPDVVTLDINMPEMDGLTCLAEIMHRSPRPVIMVSSLTASGALATLEALELGAVDYVEKPGGTVSLNLSDAAAELVDKVSRAARARTRAGGLVQRLRYVREEARARPVPRPRARTGPTTVSPELVVIGASTGGPGLLPRVLQHLPANSTASVVVVQHMPRSFTAPLAARLDGVCPLPVREVQGAVPLQPGHVYVAQGDADLVVTRRREGLVARVAPTSASHRWHPSVDRLVESVLEAVTPAMVVGVLLTGMGDDGAESMAALRSRGGRTIAESEDSAVIWGMPGQLVARDGADLVLHGDEIGQRLAEWL